MMAKWVKIKNKLDSEKLRKICELAIDTEKHIARLEGFIKSGFVDPREYIRLRTSAIRLMREFVAILKPHTPDEDKLNELKKEFSVVLTLTEREKNKLLLELGGQGYSHTVLFIARIREILDSYIYPPLLDAVNYKTKRIEQHFVTSALNRLGIKYLPELLREEEEE